MIATFSWVDVANEYQIGNTINTTPKIRTICDNISTGLNFIYFEKFLV